MAGEPGWRRDTEGLRTQNFAQEQNNDHQQQQRGRLAHRAIKTHRFGMTVARPHEVTGKIDITATLQRTQGHPGRARMRMSFTRSAHTAGKGKHQDVEQQSQRDVAAK